MALTDARTDIHTRIDTQTRTLTQLQDEVEYVRNAACDYVHSRVKVDVPPQKNLRYCKFTAFDEVAPRLGELRVHGLHRLALTQNVRAVIGCPHPRFSSLVEKKKAGMHDLEKRSESPFGKN